MAAAARAAVSFKYRGVGLITATQMAKTELLLNIIGEKIDDDPAPCLWIAPTKSNVESVIEPRFDAMVRGCVTLTQKIGGGRQKKLYKRIAGTSVRFAWAGSATEIASESAHTVIVDEVDKCEPIPGHGSVIVQAEARIPSYKHSGGIVIAASTPTAGSVEVQVNEASGLEHWTVSDPQDLQSEMWKLWQKGTRHEIMVPCPACGEYFAPRMRYLTGWDSGDSPMKAKRKAKLLHWKCGTLIDESQKSAMVAGCVDVAPGQRVVAGESVGEAPESEWYTIWVSGLLSPWVTWGDAAYKWIEAARSHDQETIRAAINTGFAELYTEKGEAPPWEDVRKISDQSTYSLGVIPRAVRKLFLTVDIQKDHLVLVARGWGVEMESWLIAREEIWGKTDEPELWQKLSDFAAKGITDHPYDAIAVDSGYRTEQAYSWCEQRLSLAIATKGRDNPNKLYSATDVEVLRNGKKIRRGMKLWSFDHGYFKGWVHDRVRWPQDQPGAWHLPMLVGDDYCRQIVGEQRKRLATGRVHWVKSSINDYLDCEALQVLLAHIEGVRYLKPDSEKPKPRQRAVRNRGVNM